ncbi:UNVERIFIED_CONTAM: hypothetical protein GTU68_047314, partial [Idotea baltica]|nr:hypothetical protein [Idotea baltica]
KVKEIFYTLQGEGVQSGRPAVFCRFSKCNLWNGREEDRANAICSFCDTDILGTDGVNGKPFVVCTGGEPALQVDLALVNALHQADFEIAIETNGTLPLPKGIDWVCCSPKGVAEVVIKRCNELKLVYPQDDAMPAEFDHIEADIIFPSEDDFTKRTIQYCLHNPKWRLNLQTHKVVNIA